ncbi:MAG TPA: hypothetical protein VNA28_06320 [Solirubrobacteraceae bacterium]|nr:hypothetical protein [Solirubrobacteraceae bacterium]
MRPKGRVSLAALAALAVAAAGCGNDEDVSSARAHQPKLNPSNFGNPATAKNRYFPLTPGYQSVRLGKVNRGNRRLEHRRVFSVSDVYKTINGIRSVAVLDQDFDGGQVGEQAIDFLAADESGNIWSLGSYTEAYEGGRFVNANDGWLTGIKGAKPGVLLPANVTAGGPAFIQEDQPGDDPSTAKVVRAGVRTCVPFKCFNDTIVVEEDGSENKSFAPGVGGIKTEPKGGGGEEETEELINLRTLSATGLREISTEVLKLDQHARSTVADVYGRSKAATRRP